MISQAQLLDAILISLDGDFSDIMAYPSSDYKGVVAIQVRNHPEAIPQLMDRLKEHWAAHPEPSYYSGRLFVAEVHRIRMRAREGPSND